MFAVPDFAGLRAGFARARNERRLRHRDAAKALGVSECEAIDAHLEASPHAIRSLRLAGDFAELVGALHAAGPLLALTRNDSAVHEKTGVYHNASRSGHVGLVLGGDIDLRVFYSHWKHGYWVEESIAKGTQRSLQFYDAAGSAVHKIFARADTDLAALASLVELFASPEQAPGIELAARDEGAAASPDDAIDVAGLRDAWAAMRDTHEFFGLLKKYGVQRTQGLRLAGEGFAKSAPVDTVRILLAEAARRELEIMVFVGNPGCIQIHTGPVCKIEPMGPWLNVLDPGFNLHLRADHVAASWVVTKPTADGVVTSLELYDARGGTIAFIFGKRKPGLPELAAWRDLIADVGGGPHPNPLPRAGEEAGS